MISSLSQRVKSARVGLPGDRLDLGVGRVLWFNLRVVLALRAFMRRVQDADEVSGYGSHIEGL